MSVDDRAEAKRREKEEQRLFDEQQAARSHIERVGKDIATVSPKAPERIIPDLLPCASTIVVGAGHEGKTVSLLYLAIKICLGLKIFGRDPREGPVLYIFGEDSTDDVKRLIHLIVRNDFPMSQLSKTINERLHLLNASMVPDRPSLLYEMNGAWREGEWFRMIERIVEGQGYSAVTMDTLSSMGLPESSGMNDAGSSYHLGANRIAQTHKLAFIGSHHIGQTAAQKRDIGMYSARGATAITDNARCVIQIQRHQENDFYQCPVPVDDMYVTRWHVLKHKWSKLDKDTPLWVTGDHYRCTDYAEFTGSKLEKAKREAMRKRRDDATEKKFREVEESIRECQRKKVPTTAANVIEFCQFGRDKTRNTLNQMVAAGRVVEERDTGSGRGRKASTYQIKVRISYEQRK